MPAGVERAGKSRLGKKVVCWLAGIGYEGSSCSSLLVLLAPPSLHRTRYETQRAPDDPLVRADTI